MFHAAGPGNLIARNGPVTIYVVAMRCNGNCDRQGQPRRQQLRRSKGDDNIISQPNIHGSPCPEHLLVEEQAKLSSAI